MPTITQDKRSEDQDKTPSTTGPSVAPPPAPEVVVTQPRMDEALIISSAIYGMRDFQKYNPDALVRSKGAGIYDKMMLDDQVKAATRFKQYAVIARPYFFNVEQDEGGEPIEEQQEISDFFQAVIKHIRGNWTDKLVEVLSAMVTGFSVCEKVYEPFTWNDKTWWGLKDIKLKPFDSFDGGFKLDPYGNILELKQTQAGNEIPVPLSKILHFVYQPDKDRVYGESDLRAAYRSWWSKDIVIKFQNIHLERHASGFIWAKLVQGQSLDPSNLSNLQSIMKNISAAMAAIMPPGVELNSMQPLRTDEYEKAVAQHDKSISKSILVPNLLGLSEQGSVGSYSQSEVQLKSFFFVLNQVATSLAELLNEQLFRELALWNFGTEEFPLFTFDQFSDEQKVSIIRLWNELCGKSVTRSDADEAYVRNMLGFPEKSDDATEEDPIPGDGEGIFPMDPKGGQIEDEEEDENEDEEDLPDNDDWVEKQPDEKKENIRRLFASKPWLKRVDFAKIQGHLDRGDERLSKQLSDIMGMARVDIERQVVKIVGNRSLGKINPREIEGIKMPAKLMKDLRRSLRTGLTDALTVSYQNARREMPKRRLAKAPYRPGMDKTQAERFLTSRTMRIAGVIEQSTLKAVQNVLENGIRYDKSLSQVMKEMAIDTDLLEMLPPVDAAGRAINVPARLETIARTNNAYAWNEARQALFNEPEFKGFVTAFEYSAILDDRVSGICEALDGKIQKDWGSYTPPNHFNALPEGTMIQVKGGKKPIEDIRVGDKVYTHLGRFMPVTDTMKHETWPEEIVLHLEGGKTLTLTEDHPVMTDRGWVCAGDLTTDDEVISLAGPCETCGKITTHARYCSNECKNIGNIKEKTCSHCGTEYHGANAKYCSKACEIESRKRRCEHCGEEIMMKGKKKNKRYCSQKCMGAAMRTLPEKQCKQCGEPLVGKWKAPIYKDRLFCSQECYFAYKGETSIEATVREFLAINHIQAKRQYQVGRYSVDLFLPDFNLAIEADGEYWHGAKEKPANVIEAREKFILGKGMSILHLPESAIKSGRFKKMIAEAIHELQTAASKDREDRAATL